MLSIFIHSDIIFRQRRKLKILAFTHKKVVQTVKNPPAMQETQVRSLAWKDPLEKGMATHSSILAWRIPWTEEPGGLQSMGSRRVGHNWVTNTHIHKKMSYLKKKKQTHFTSEIPRALSISKLKSPFLPPTPQQEWRHKNKVKEVVMKRKEDAFTLLTTDVQISTPLQLLLTLMFHHLCVWQTPMANESQRKWVPNS